MIINVKAEHIARGVKCAWSRCPVARSLRDLFPRGEITVLSDRFDSDVITVGDRTWVITKRLAAWIDRFDSGKPVSPATFSVKEW